MNMLLFCPDRESASRMAKRVLPGSRIVRIEERPDPAEQHNLKAFWRDVQDRLHPPGARRQRAGAST